MNRRVSYGCSQLRFYGRPRRIWTLPVFFYIILILCSCDKAHLLSKERDSLCLWIAICVLNILCRRKTIEIEKNLIFPDFHHVWVDLDMTGEHLDIIGINNKNPEINVLIH